MVEGTTDLVHIRELRFQGNAEGDVISRWTRPESFLYPIRARGRKACERFLKPFSSGARTTPKETAAELEERVERTEESVDFGSLLRLCKALFNHADRETREPKGFSFTILGMKPEFSKFDRVHNILFISKWLDFARILFTQGLSSLLSLSATRIEYAINVNRKINESIIRVIHRILFDEWGILSECWSILKKEERKNKKKGRVPVTTSLVTGEKSRRGQLISNLSSWKNKALYPA